MWAASGSAEFQVCTKNKSNSIVTEPVHRHNYSFVDPSMDDSLEYTSNILSQLEQPKAYPHAQFSVPPCSLDLSWRGQSRAPFPIGDSKVFFTKTAGLFNQDKDNRTNWHGLGFSTTTEGCEEWPYTEKVWGSNALLEWSLLWPFIQFSPWEIPCTNGPCDIICDVMDQSWFPWISPFCWISPFQLNQSDSANSDLPFLWSLLVLSTPDSSIETLCRRTLLRGPCHRGPMPIWCLLRHGHSWLFSKRLCFNFQFPNIGLSEIGAEAWLHCCCSHSF